LLPFWALREGIPNVVGLGSIPIARKPIGMEAFPHVTVRTERPLFPIQKLHASTFPCRLYSPPHESGRSPNKTAPDGYAKSQAGRSDGLQHDADSSGLITRTAGRRSGPEEGDLAKTPGIVTKSRGRELHPESNIGLGIPESLGFCTCCWPPQVAVLRWRRASTGSCVVLPGVAPETARGAELPPWRFVPLLCILAKYDG